MIEDIQIIDAAYHAKRVKEAVPNLDVSVDAIFLAFILGKRRPGRPGPRIKIEKSAPAPEWFDESLKNLSGQRLTIMRFLMLSGRFPYDRDEARAVGRWLRASGRWPKKIGGNQLFEI